MGSDPVLKKSKKKKKKSKKEPKEQVAASTETLAPAVVTDVTSEKKKKKKSKKNKKKSKKEEGVRKSPRLAALAGEPAEELVSLDDAKPKKEKEEKKVKISNNGSTVMQQMKSMNGGVYKEDPEITAWADSGVEAYRKEKLMAIENCNIKPVKTFEQTGLPAALLKCTSGFKEPSPIQSQAWPILLSGRDVIGVAKTGSGKTLAFLLPGMLRFLKEMGKKKPVPGLLVLTPTRELAMQIEQVCKEAGDHLGIRQHCIYGGVPKYVQIQAINKGLHIIVATPGRLLSLIRERKCNISQVDYMVLDEADRMLDLGFKDDIAEIFGYIKEKRQTLLFSATWPKEVQEIAAQYITNPVKINIGSTDELAANKDIKQIVEVVEDRQKDAKLLKLIGEYHKSRTNRVIIFVLYKKDVQRVERLLQKNRWKCVGISSNYSQQERTQALSNFKSGKIPVLVATDVAARGLDIPNVEYVINYSFPLTAEDYVHRIGRTGRGGKKGVSHTFFTTFDKNLAGELTNLLRDAGQPVPEALTKFGTGVKRKAHSMYGAFYKRSSDTNKPMGVKKHVKLC